jgi:hypothetical protein
MSLAKNLRREGRGEGEFLMGGREPIFLDFSSDL